MNKSSTKVFLLLVGMSTAIHAVLLVAWFHTSEKKTYSISKKYTINLELSSKLTEKASARKSISNDVVKKETAKNQQDKNSRKASLVESSQKVSGNYNELNKLLHIAINKNKHYPLSALRLNREGTVQLTFNLLNNGSINNLKISNSSGYNVLDKAALKAVKKIQPFKAAKQYIASVENFLLDIKFQL